MKGLKKFLTILSLSLLLTSCTWPLKPEVETVTEYVYVTATIPTISRPKPVNLVDVDFDVVSYKNLNEFLADNEVRNGVIVFVAMDIREYEALSTNTAELRRYIEQQMGIIEFYENNINKAKEMEESNNVVSETK